MFRKLSQTKSIFLSLFFMLLLLAMTILSGCNQPGSNVAQAAQANNGRTIQNKGSDTMVNLALAWAEAYRNVNPAVGIAVTGGGSGTGIAALINGTADIANASRKMTDNEIAEAKKNGIAPVEFTVAIDALAVIVNPANPVHQLTIGQLADIFTGRITNWKAVGGNDATIVLLSRETNSGTHVYFLENVVRKGDKKNKDIFAPQTLLMPSSVGITSEVQRNPNAIGYDGLGYVDAQHEQLIAIAANEQSTYVAPSVQSGADGTYPIARGLYMYTAGEPTGGTADYMNWIRGTEGQKIVSELGFVPLPKR